MKYETYWSVLDTANKSIRSYHVFVFIILISLISWILIKKFKKSNGDIEKSILLWSIGIVFTISTSAFFYLKINDRDESYKNTERILKSSNVMKVEGLIKNFKNGIARRRVRYESFTVDSVNFYYSDELLGKFNSFGDVGSGVLKNDLPVRITYEKENNKILKIEIGE